MLVNDLIMAVKDEARGQYVSDARLGLGYTGVSLSGGGCGLAATIPHEGSCSVIDSAGTLPGMPAGDIIEWAGSNKRAEVAVGIGAINALLSYRSYDFLSGDPFDHIEIKKTDTAALIGFIPPVFKELRNKAGKLYLFERRDLGNIPELVPEEKMKEILPGCDIVIFTGSTCVNETVDNILEMSPSARARIMIGPSTPLCPEVMGKYGIHLLCGVVIIDCNKILEIISQGGGTRHIGPYIKKISLGARPF
ncbi:MAG: DUF364 domain-containing protein [Candidatus Eremiobacteraeota bacterium]|nr:DUF364 domain-containing protein [Candidatus Eremiobacteraeota bacterium]